MKETSLCLAFDDSLRMLRYARRREDLRLVPAGDVSLCGKDIGGGLAALPQDLFSISRKRPLNAHFEESSARSQSVLVHPSVLPKGLAEGALLEVTSVTGAPFFTSTNMTVHVYVESAGYSLLSAARAMNMLVRQGQLSRDAALVRVIALAMELCGRYARDPSQPLVGEVVHDIEPVATTRELTEFLSRTTGVAGLSLARRAASYANDGSGSTMETLWYAVFCLPPRLGGSHLARPLQNVALEWPADVEGIVSHGTMRPDFHWPQYMLACEHQGGDHVGEQALQEDSDRARDYELCHIHYLPLTKKDAADEPSVRALLAQVFEVISAHEDEAFRRKARRILNDPDVRAARKVLLAQLLPPRTRWG